MKCDGIFRLTRLNPDRRIQCSAAEIQFDDVAVLELFACG